MGSALSWGQRRLAINLVQPTLIVTAAAAAAAVKSEISEQQFLQIKILKKRVSTAFVIPLGRRAASLIFDLLSAVPVLLQRQWRR